MRESNVMLFGLMIIRAPSLVSAGANNLSSQYGHYKNGTTIRGTVRHAFHSSAVCATTYEAHINNLTSQHVTTIRCTTRGAIHGEVNLCHNMWRSPWRTRGVVLGAPVGRSLAYGCKKTSEPAFPQNFTYDTRAMILECRPWVPTFQSR